MKKKSIVGIGATVLALSIVSLGAILAFGAADTSSLPNMPPVRAEQAFGRPGVPRRELSDTEKADMETKRAEREDMLNAFMQTLSDEQKELYEAMKPAQPRLPEGERPEKPCEADRTAIMAAMKEKRDTFIASLTEEQKTRYDALFDVKNKEWR